MLSFNLAEKLVQEKEKQIEESGINNADTVAYANNILAKAAEEDLDTMQLAGFRVDKIKAAANLHQVLTNDPRIFTISDIERICKKYDLKFLRTEKFHGSIPTNIAQSIRDSMENYTIGIVCKDAETMFHIAAPIEMFDLKPYKMVDPLLFMPLNRKKHGVDENGNCLWLLVDKWGDDMSAWRRLLGFRRYHAGRWSMIINAITCSILYKIVMMIWGFHFNSIGVIVTVAAYLISLWIGHDWREETREYKSDYWCREYI